MMRIYCIFIVMLTAVLSLQAQSFDEAKMNSLFSVIEEKDRGMGSVSLFQNGEEIYQHSYGYADHANKKKSDPNTKYRIGSISKIYTATIIVKLIEDEMLALSATLDGFYPQISNANIITIANLLQHRSGIANFTSDPDFSNWHTETHTKEQLLSRITNSGVTFEPDEKMEYSNSNYVLLAFIAEDVSSKTLAQLLEDMIIKPCNLKRTGIGSKINVSDNEAFSYTRLLDWHKASEIDMSIMFGCGFIVSTASEVNTVINALFSGKIIGSQHVNKMIELKDNFGFGFFRMPYNDVYGWGYGHSGRIDEFHGITIYFPDKKLSVTVLSNGLYYPMNDMLVGILNIYYGQDYTLPVFADAEEMSAEFLNQFVGVYSSSQLPMKLTINVMDNVLIAQGTGQPAFPLEYVEGAKFKFDRAQLELEFSLEENKVYMKQPGVSYEMKKEQSE